MSHEKKSEREREREGEEDVCLLIPRFERVSQMFTRREWKREEISFSKLSVLFCSTLHSLSLSFALSLVLCLLLSLSDTKTIKREEGRENSITSFRSFTLSPSHSLSRSVFHQISQSIPLLVIHFTFSIPSLCILWRERGRGRGRECDARFFFLRLNYHVFRTTSHSSLPPSLSLFRTFFPFVSLPKEKQKDRGGRRERNSSLKIPF